MTASKERILKICEYCGKSFYASKSTTRYCSKQCNSYAYKAARREEKVKMAETMSHRKASEKSMSEILVKEYLTIQEVAILLGLSRQTIYNMVYSGKLRASKITSRLSLIRKRDIDYLVDSLPYTTKKSASKEAVHANRELPVPEYYSAKEIAEVHNTYGSIRNRQLYCGLGVNYQISNNSFIGASFNFNRMFNKAVSNIATTIYKDYAFTEESASDIAKPGNMSLASSNVYYMGKIGIVDINFNTDWLWDKDFSKVNTLERYQEYGGDWQDKAVHTKTNTKNELFASKLTLTLPFWKGQLSFGGEYSNTNRNSSYDVQPMGLLDKQDNRIKEGMASVFCDYTRKFGQLRVLAGIRYENTDFNYYEEGKRIPEQSKRYGNLLPSLSLSLPVGKTQMQLSYGATIKRPSYYDMRSGIGYDNRYTYESGNPFLVSEISRNINYMVSYKWLMAEGIYTHVSDPIVMLTQSYKDNPNIALIQNVNWKPYNRIGASLSASPKFGIWHPSLRFHFFKQWFDMETHGGHGLDNPKITVRFDNTIDTKFCTISLLLTAQTKGDDETSYMYRNYFSSNLSIYKSFLKGKMVVFFYANDLLGTGNMHSKMYSGSMREIIHHDYSISEYSLTIRYRFNVAKKKYKGTGAGQSQKSRMSL